VCTNAAFAVNQASAAAQAYNQVANITVFNVQSCYIGALTESDDDANHFWLC
jgi:hypothetical protein